MWNFQPCFAETCSASIYSSSRGWLTFASKSLTATQQYQELFFICLQANQQIRFDLFWCAHMFMFDPRELLFVGKSVKGMNISYFNGPPRHRVFYTTSPTREGVNVYVVVDQVKLSYDYFFWFNALIHFRDIIIEGYKSLWCISNRPSSQCKRSKICKLSTP